MNYTNIIEVGKLPPPQGGISTHLERLQKRSLNEFENTSLRLFFCNLSLSPLLSFRGCSISNWGITEISRGIACRGKNHLFHIHASTGNNLFSLCSFIWLFFPKSRVWLTFHHGALESVWEKLSVEKTEQLRKVLTKSSKIICVSKTQTRALRSFGVQDEKVSVCSSYIKLNNSLASHSLSPLKEKSCKVGTSGYGKSYYQFNLVIESVKSIRAFCPNVTLEILLYGSIDPCIESYLSEQKRDCKWLTLLSPCSSSEFKEWLSGLSVYVRMTLVDSFGLALAEAHEVGTPTIASDICVRPPDTIIIPPDSMELLTSKILEVLKSPMRVYGNTPDGFEELKKLYMEILNE